MKYTIALVLLFLVGCSSSLEISGSHEDLLLSKGWKIDKVLDQSEFDLHLLPEVIEMYKNAGLELSEYLDKKVKVTNYLLVEKQSDGNPISIRIYEYQGEMIGGIGHLEEWDPGVFNMNHKKQLEDQGIILK